MSLELSIPNLGLSETELDARFDELQARLGPLWQAIQSLDDDGEQTIVVVPSLTVDFDALQGSVLQAYEERFLFLLLLLRQPSARLIYVTSQPIHPNVVDYYLDLLPGIISSHARARLHLLAPHDGAPQPLSVKMLQRPRLLAQIRKLIPDPKRAHLVPFNTTVHERNLALRLGIPLYGADPRHLHFGTKSGCRRLFREAGMALPRGTEDIGSMAQLVEAIIDLRKSAPDLKSAMVKHNDGVSGEGNAVLDLVDLDPSPAGVDERLNRMRLEAKHLTIETFLDKFFEMGGIVEERVLGDRIESPSSQMRITPLGKVELLSTHDQLLGGAEGQKYEGCTFPAHSDYAKLITDESMKVGDRLVKEGVLGRFAIDFVVAHRHDGWHPYAIELNLRKGGTTHPFLTLQFLTNGTYVPEEARFVTPDGREKHYVATDAMQSEAFRAFSHDDLFDIAVRHGLHYDQVRQTGIVFHMMSAIGDHGRLGLTAVGDTPAHAAEVFQKTKDVLADEAKAALKLDPLPDV